MSDSGACVGLDCFCPPRLNTDIAGIGVRLSFYLQALFLFFLSARSDDLNEVTDSLYLLVTTNIAMCIITSVLAFKSNPEITLQDALVVLYLLSLSSFAVFFSTVRYSRFKHPDQLRDRALEWLSAIQLYFFFVLSLVILEFSNTSFGSLPLCNVDARLAIFRPFRFLPAGRIISIVFVLIVTTIYTFWGMPSSDLELLSTINKWIIKQWVILLRRLLVCWRKIRSCIISYWKRASGVLRKGMRYLHVPVRTPSPQDQAVNLDLEPSSTGPKKGPRVTTDLSTGREVQDIEPSTQEDECDVHRSSQPHETNRSMADMLEGNPEIIESYPQVNSSAPHEPITYTSRKECVTRSKLYSRVISGTLIFDLLVNFLPWTIGVASTELLVKWNKFKEPEEPQWQFGQMLAVLIVILPLTNSIKAFARLGFFLSPYQQTKMEKNNEDKVRRASALHGLRPDLDVEASEAGLVVNSGDVTREIGVQVHELGAGLEDVEGNVPSSSRTKKPELESKENRGGSPTGHQATGCEGEEPDVIRVSRSVKALCSQKWRNEYNLASELQLQFVRLLQLAAKSSPEASDALASILQDYPEIYAWLLCKDGERFRELIDNLAKQPNHSRVHNLLEHHLKGLHLLCCRYVKQEDHSQQIEWRMWGSGDHSESFSEELKIWAELESSINPRYLPGWIDWRTAVENFSDSLAKCDPSSLSISLFYLANCPFPYSLTNGKIESLAVLMHFQVLESIFENEYVFEPTVIPLLFAFMGKLLKYCDDIKAPDIGLRDREGLHNRIAQVITEDLDSNQGITYLN